MATLQSAMALHSNLETVLRRSLEEGRPRTFHEIYDVPDVQRNAKNVQQIRDIVYRWLKLGLVVKNDMTKFGDHYKVSDVGWTWNPNPLPKVEKPNPRKPSKPTVTRFEKGPKEVEIVIDDITVVVGKNPVTGRIRVVIE